MTNKELINKLRVTDNQVVGGAQGHYEEQIRLFGNLFDEAIRDNDKKRIARIESYLVAYNALKRGA